MSCTNCKKIKIDEEKRKRRELAQKIAEADGKTQIIIEHEGKFYIESEECYQRSSTKTGTPVEYFIV